MANGRNLRVGDVAKCRFSQVRKLFPSFTINIHSCLQESDTAGFWAHRLFSGVHSTEHSRTDGCHCCVQSLGSANSPHLGSVRRWAYELVWQDHVQSDMPMTVKDLLVGEPCAEVQRTWEVKGV